MRISRFYLPSLVLGLLVLASNMAERQAHAEGAQPIIQVVPNIPHFAMVSSVAFSPDGARVLSGSLDKTLKLWDVETGALIRTFEGHSNAVGAVAYSADGVRAVSSSSDETVKLWDVANGVVVRTFQHSAGVISVALSTDGSRVLSGSDKTVTLWDTSSGAVVAALKGHSGEIASVAISADGSRALSGSSDKTLKLWDVGSRTVARTFVGHAGEVRAVAFSPDGTRVLSGSADKTLKLWDSATGALLRTIPGYSELARSVAFSPDGRFVLSPGDKRLTLWDATTGTLVRTFEGLGSEPLAVAFSPDGSRILSGNWNNTLQLWDVTTGKALGSFENRAGGVTSVAISANGSRLLSGDRDATTKLWDATSGALVRIFRGHLGPVYSAAISTDGTRVLSGSGDGTLKLWDVATGGVLRTFDGHSDEVISGALSADGSRVLSGSRDRTMKLWDAETGGLLRTFEGHAPSGVLAVAFSSNGRRVLSGHVDRSLRLWDVETGALERTFAGHSLWISSVAMSSDGTRILSGSWDGTLKLWDESAAAAVHTFHHAPSVTSAAISADGARVMSGGWDGTLKLWNAATGALIRSFKGHFARVNSVAFSPDGRTIVSGGDTTTRIWDAASGAELVTLSGDRDGEWMAMTSVGFLATSSKATKMLNVVRGINVTATDQVHQSLYNPDLVRETLAGDRGGEVAEAAKVINLERVLDSGPSPSVSIRSPASGSRSAKDLITVTARIEDRGKGVGRIEWRVNGITTAVTAKLAGAGPIHTATQPVALDPGDNVIEVVAYNGSNLLASLPARTTVKFRGPIDKARPKLHILAIGINAYVDKGWTSSDSNALFSPLDLAVKDAEAFAANMREAASGLYGEVRVTLALNEEATRDNLLKVVDKIAAQIHPRDTFILFAAGHGYSVGGRFYLIPQDYQGGTNPEALATRAIGQEKLQDWLANRIKAKRAIILLDTCESGALVGGYARSRIGGPASEAAVGRLHEATGRPVLTAAAAGQFAHEGLIGASGERHGVFTWAVLNALRTGDINGNGTIELSELVRHVQSVVPKVAADLGGAGRAATSEPVYGQQTARFGSRGEEFIVAKRLR